ncbi:MAG: phosphoribosyltransferase [Flavobacteriales bacterium]|nr:phosphoribosyltransferase [Flavobacteriales bacterium]
MKRKQIILNKKEINNKINRISFSIIEDYHKKELITLIGFEKNGYIIAKKIKESIHKEHDVKISLHNIKYVKNLNYKVTPPLNQETSKHIFLVDDVLKSVKTIIHGIKDILNKNILSLKTIILVNRNHNQFPIGVDYVGLNLSTTLQDHIEVIFEKNQEIVYLM